MTELRPTPHVMHAETAVDHHVEQSHARYRIATRITDGIIAPHTRVRDALGGSEAVNGRVSTSSLRDLAAALIEHADAIDMFRDSYREATWATHPVEVFPGFPLTLTTAADVDLDWPDGVVVRDEDGRMWTRIDDAWAPDSDSPTRELGEDHHGTPAYLPACIIPTSWPTPAANATTEN